MLINRLGPQRDECNSGKTTLQGPIWGSRLMTVSFIEKVPCPSVQLLLILCSMKVLFTREETLN